MTKTSIEWATDVWNPVTGCTKVSAGCKNCYAEKIAERFWGDRKFTDVECHPERLEDPLRWKKPRRIFVNSMSDLFHESVSDEFIWSVFSVMAVAEQHTYMILTKRPRRMSEYLFRWKNIFTTDSYSGPENIFLHSWPLPNVWLGVSVENQQAADERIPYLLQTPAAVRFVSVEPMFGPLSWLKHYLPCKIPCPRYERDGKLVVADLDWVICGCESGTGARPFDMDWARDLRDQCQNANVPFFFKQGRVGGKLVKMPELDGQVWNEFPEVQACATLRR